MAIAYGVLIPGSLRHSAFRTGIFLSWAFIPDVVVFTRIGVVTGLGPISR